MREAGFFHESLFLQKCFHGGVVFFYGHSPPEDSFFFQNLSYWKNIVDTILSYMLFEKGIEFLFG
jgi:hypothetical protein